MEVLKSEPLPLNTVKESSFSSESNAELVTNSQMNLICPPYTTKPISPDINVDELLPELHAGLTDKNWEVRNQTLVELQKLIPDAKIDLQSKICKEIVRLVTANLANIVPYVRRNALDVILALIKFSHNDAEVVLKNVIVHGVDTPSTDNNLSLHTLQHIPTILEAIQQRNKSKNVSHQLLVQMVTSLSKRMVQITHQKQVVSSFLRIKNLIGESMFDHFLETYYPQVKRDFDVLCNVYDIYSEPSDQSDTEEPKISQIDFEECGNSDDDVIMKVYDEDGNEIKRSSSRRVTFGGEIVKIRTPDSDATVVNAVKDKLNVDTNIVVQLSSDESLDSGNESITVSTQEEIKSEKARPRSSHIPLPIRPALHKPKPSPTILRQSSMGLALVNDAIKQKSDYEILNEIPNYEGESLTSSSDSSDRGKAVFVTNASLSMNDHHKASTLKHNTLMELTQLNINDRVVLENLFKKDDWRFYTNGLERLTQVLSQPQIMLSLSSPDVEPTGISLLCYVFNGLTETKNNRVIISSLRVLRILCQAIEPSLLALNMAAIVPIFCSYLNGEYDNDIQLEAVETLKMLMRKFSPQTIVDFLFTEQCFFSKSSKMRENTLLCLMYALLTFPSTEFNVNELAQTLIKQGIDEPKRRVRQALLDALSILGQFIPRSQFKIDNANQETLAFKRALRARLTRRQLPSISSSGLLLYAFQISPGTAFGTDIEWILSGSGSLSDNSNKSKAKFNYAHGDDMSPMQSQQSWNQGYDKTDSAKDCSQPFEYNQYLQNTLIGRGNSEEILYNHHKQYESGHESARKKLKTRLINEIPYNEDNNNGFERYSADWTDSRYSSNYFDNLHQRYPSNLSDSSSYASSYASDQNFPKLNPAYDSNLMSIGRPVSEEKLNRLSWSSKYKQSKLPIRLEPTVRQLPIHYSYNTGGSLPILNDKKDKNSIFQSFYQNQKIQDNLQLSSDSDSKTRWSKNSENNLIKSKYRTESNANVGQMKNKNNIQPSENHKNTNNTVNAMELKRDRIVDKGKPRIKAKNIEKEDKKELRVQTPQQPTPQEKNPQEQTAPEQNFHEEELEPEKEEQEDPEDKITDLPNEEQNRFEEKIHNMYIPESYKEKSKKFLERKAGVKLKRSLTKEIKMPQNTFSINPEELPPFENPKEAISRVLDQFQSNEWETVIEALQGVVRLTRHHAKYLAPCLHTFVIAVAKEVRNLRSQVSRAACLSAENIFRTFDKIPNQDIEELSHALFLRTADTNKFLREDSNKALDAMVENTKFTKCALILTQKIASHPNALVRATTARLIEKMVEIHGPSKVLALSKDKKDAILQTVVKFLMDGNLQTRTHGKNILMMLTQDKRTFPILSEIIPSSVMLTVNKFLRNVKKL